MATTIIQPSVIQPAVTQPLAVSVESQVALGAERVQGASEAHWYATYTLANHEKGVASQLAKREVEHFLPLYSSVRRWKDRCVKLELPLFPGYVFVRLALRDRMRVLQIPSIVRLVGFGGLPTALPDTEMEVLRSGLCDRSRAEPHAFLTVGKRVRIIGGPFAGLVGVLRRKQNNLRVVVSLEMIQRSMVVDVGVADVKPTSQLRLNPAQMLGSEREESVLPKAFCRLQTKDLEHA